MSSTEFTFIECSTESAIEINDENNKYLTRVDGGIVIPENSRITVENAFVNVLGADADVIELTGRKIGDNKYFEYSNTTNTYEELTSEVFDNKVQLTLEYYKNDDMNYCFYANYPYYDYVGDFPTMTPGKENYEYQLTAKGMQKINVSGAVFIISENEKGVNSSNNFSTFGYNFPHDNRRYTICGRNEFTKYNNSSNFNGVERGGLRYARDTAFFDYSVYRKSLDIVVTQGQNTASSIAEQISQQLTKVSEPKILEGLAWEAEPAKATNTWTNSQGVNYTTVMDNPTFALINCGTRRSFWKGANYNFFLPSANNTNTEAFRYQDNFEFIGVYDPDVFITGRNVNLDSRFASKGFNHYLTSTVNATPNTGKIVLKTSIPYDETILRGYHNLFEYQVANPDLWQNQCAQVTGAGNITPKNTVFLHLETEDVVVHVLNDEYFTTPFGSDTPMATGVVGTKYNTSMTNAVYLEYDPTQKDVFGEKLAFGVFTRRVVGKHSFCNVTAYIPIDGNGTSLFYDLPMSLLTAEPDNAAGLPPDDVFQLRRIGWDRHFSANGNQSIILYNGLKSNSNLQVNVAHVDAGGAQSAFSPESIYSNSFEDAQTGTEYFYDTAINQLYVGSDSCQLGFDLNESRFIFSNFHTPRSENNLGISGFDSAVMVNIPVIQTGSEGLFYPDSVNDGLTSQIEIPIQANPNANAPIYQISPSDLAESTNTIFGMVNSKDGNADGLKTNTIFDSMTGCYIASFGIDENTYKGSLFEILGFSFNQIKSYMSSDFFTHFVLNRNARKLNQGVNITDVIEYPFTTNADIQANEIRTWRTNPFGLSYFNTLTPPSNMRVLQASLPAGKGAVTYTLQDEVKKYEVTQNQTSTKLFAERLASKTLIPFYQIRSDILQDQFQYFGGNKNMSGRLPCVTMVNKSEPGADYYSQSSSGVEYIIKKRLVINNIVTEIYDNVGRLAKNISPFSSIIYRIEKMYNPPGQSIPFNTIRDMEMAELEKENQKKKK